MSRSALSLAVAGALAVSSLWGAPGSIKSDYAAVIAELDRTCDWQFCHDKRLRKAWALVECGVDAGMLLQEERQ